MSNRKNKYYYLNNKETAGAVFETQVVDWLHFFKTNNVDFQLIQLFHIKDIITPRYVSSQLEQVRNKTNALNGHLFFFPSKGYGAYLNTILLFFKLFWSLVKNEKTVVFSRALIGREIRYLKKLFPSKLTFVFDARAASAEENKYTATKIKDFRKKRYKLIANIFYLEYITLLSADKIFSVSNRLSKYFIDTFCVNEMKFILYPCLAVAEKFSYDLEERRKVRMNLGLSNQTKVFIYAGGISSKWHKADRMLMFFKELMTNEKDALFLFLSNDEQGFTQLMSYFPELEKSVKYKNVPNNEVYKYLNAADYGLLFRENSIMNNVASPTKFAEYILCGLPVIISEGVGDYSTFTCENNVGVVLTQSELLNPKSFDYGKFLHSKFDRKEISQLGKKFFSKESAIETLSNVFKNV